MQVDPEYLRQHYASLSDEELLSVDRAELVPAAQTVLDQEISNRRLTGRVDRAITSLTEDEEPEAETEEYDEYEEEEEPDWLDDAIEVRSWATTNTDQPSGDALEALQALKRAGIPCYLELSELAEGPSPQQYPTHQWRLLAPNKLNLRATGILERDILNAEFEDSWKAQLEALSDEELRSMDPKIAFCGLYDRLARLNRVYAEEVARRKASA